MYNAETRQNAIEPVGEVRDESTGALLKPGTAEEGLAQAIRVASLCNIAS